jgi:predicted permease
VAGLGRWLRIGLIDALIGDTRYAIRTLRRSPLFTLVVVLTIAVGLGVNTAVFTVTNAVLFKAFRGVARNDRVVYIHSTRNGQYAGVSYPDFQDWRAQATSFEGMGAVGDLAIALDDEAGFAQSYIATRITVDGFRVLGLQPVLGRDFVAADGLPGAAPVAILNYEFWERRFASDSTIIGQTLRIHGSAPTVVVGVMPKGFSFPQDQALWVPLTATAELQPREARSLWFAFGRLKDGVSIERARSELDAIGQRLATTYRRTNVGHSPRPETFTQFFILQQIDRNALTTYRALWAAVGFVLLIACANVANLLLVRAIERTREISLRMALGAGRWRIVRQLVIESTVLAGLGAGVGYLIARGALRIYWALSNPSVGSWHHDFLDYTMDWRALVYLAAISTAAALLFGLAPALRCASLDLHAATADGGRAISGERRGRRLAAVLVGGEVALAVLLLTGASLMVRSFRNLAASLGVKTETMTMRVRLPQEKYASPDSRTAFWARLRPRLESVPGVDSIAVGTEPGSGSGRRPYELAADPLPDVRRRPAVVVNLAGAGFFRTFETPVLAGREFTVDDGTNAPVAVVNQRFAAEHWPDGNAIGQQLRFYSNTGATYQTGDGDAPGAWLTVIGVVPNIAVAVGGHPDIAPAVYVPSDRIDSSVFIRTRMPASALARPLRREMSAVDPDVPIRIGTLDEQLGDWSGYGGIRNEALVFAVFAAIALLLASVGLYAVVAHAVSQRTQEIGIRTAMGATAGDILKLVLGQGMAPVGVGLVVGLLASLAVLPVLRSLLIAVSANDPASLVAASVMLMFAAALGCLIPAYRATRVDPMVALRHD